MSFKRPIYLDHHATTPIDSHVLNAMMPTLKDVFGNASSRNHSFGWKASECVDRARAQISSLIGSEPEEIVFTSGATESINLAIKGAARMYREKGNHIVTCVTEHRAVLDTCRALEREGFEISYVPVDSDGRVSPGLVNDLIGDRTILIAIMHANNEIGTIQPIDEIGRIAREKGVLFFCDATQSVGKIPVNVAKSRIDLMSFSAHKMYGPKGVGALYVRSRKPHVRLSPIIDGGGHESGFRSGTLNVPGIVGFGAACELAGKSMLEESRRVSALRDRLREGIFRSLDGAYVNGSQAHRLPNNLNLSFAYVEGESLLTGLCEDVAVSSGSACTSASLEPSYVLKAIGVGEDLIHSTIRFGLGRFNTEEEIDFAIRCVVDAVRSLRELSPVYAMMKESAFRRMSA